MRQLWDLLEGRALFDAVDPPKHEYDGRTHLALITALIGVPPADLLARGRRTHLFYDSEGLFFDFISSTNTELNLQNREAQTRHWNTR